MVIISSELLDMAKVGNCRSLIDLLKEESIQIVYKKSNNKNEPKVGCQLSEILSCHKRLLKIDLFNLHFSINKFINIHNNFQTIDIHKNDTWVHIICHAAI